MTSLKAAYLIKMIILLNIKDNSKITVESVSALNRVISSNNALGIN